MQVLYHIKYMALYKARLVWKNLRMEVMHDILCMCSWAKAYFG